MQADAGVEKKNGQRREKRTKERNGMVKKRECNLFDLIGYGSFSIG